MIETKINAEHLTYINIYVLNVIIKPSYESVVVSVNNLFNLS